MSFMFFSEAAAVPPHIIPEDPTLVNYFNILGFSYFTHGQEFLPSGSAELVIKGIRNSLLVGLPVTAITMIVATPVAYAFGRLKFRHKNKLLFTLLTTRAVPPISILIPYFIMFQNLKLLGTISGLIIITLSITIPLLIWCLMGFFATLPRDLERAARMDGHSKMGAFLRIVIPVAKPGIAVGAIISFLFAWNEYTFSMIISGGYPSQTLPIAVSGLLFMQPEPTLLAAATTISLIFPFAICFFLQKYITDLHIVDPFGR